ncbi:MAG: nuclear transport factor 2 family protein [Chitinophagaceae bacterium]
MKPFISVSLLIFLFCTASAQTEKEQVEDAVRNYVEAFYLADTVKIHQSIAKDVVKYGYAIPKGKTQYERFPDSFQQMISSITKYGKFPTQIPVVIEVFDVLDQTASAKLIAGWGIDYILLAKQKGNWMVTHVLWQTAPVKK